jgi:hypothetical protein
MLIIIIIVLVTAMLMGKLRGKCTTTFDTSAIAHVAAITCKVFNHHLTIPSSILSRLRQHSNA